MLVKYKRFFVGLIAVGLLTHSISCKEVGDRLSEFNDSKADTAAISIPDPPETVTYDTVVGKDNIVILGFDTTGKTVSTDTLWYGLATDTLPKP